MTSSKAELLAISSGVLFFPTITGIKIYPNFFLVSLDKRKALPEACTISITLRLGSLKTTQSIAGKSTPSVRQRALVINPFCFLNSLICFVLSELFIFPEIWKVSIFLKF